MDEDSELKLFDAELALSYFGDEEEFLVMQLKTGIEAFNKGDAIDKLIQSYKRNDWHIISSEEWKTFERDAHSLKGRSKLMGLTQLAHRLEKLQNAIKEGHSIQVGMILEKVLQAARPTHQALLEYLKEPTDTLFTYDSNDQYDFYSRFYKTEVKQGLKLCVQPPKLVESNRLARYLAMKRDPGLKCCWNEEPQDDPKEVKCVIF